MNAESDAVSFEISGRKVGVGAPAYLTVENGRIGFLLDAGSRTGRRQDVPPVFHRNGLCYALRRKPFLDGAPILDTRCAAVVIDRPVANIDDPFEFKLAEWLLERQGLGVSDLPVSEIA